MIALWIFVMLFDIIMTITAVAVAIVFAGYGLPVLAVIVALAFVCKTIYDFGEKDSYQLH